MTNCINIYYINYTIIHSITHLVSLTENQYFGFQYQGGDVNFKLWADITTTEIANVQAEVNIANLRLTPASTEKNSAAANIQNLDFACSWKQTADRSWTLLFDETNVMINKKPWPETKVGIWVEHPHLPTATISAMLDSAVLQNFDLVMANFSIIPTKLRQLWTTFKPRGVVEHLDFIAQGNFANLATYHLVGKVSNIGLSPAQNIPGMSGISAIMTTHSKSSSSHQT